MLGGLDWSGAIVNDAHKGFCHTRGVLVLDYVSAVDDAACALDHEVRSTTQDYFVGDTTSASNENWDAAGNADYLVVLGDIIARIGFDDIGPKLYGLTDER